jgi:hypothetical protein
LIRSALLALALAACSPLPDRPIGVWDRIFSNGQPIAPGAVDQLTITQKGNVILARDGGVQRGRWEEDLSSQMVTLVLDGVTTTWLASRPLCPDGSRDCIVLSGPGETDWYVFDWPAYEQP